DVVRKYDANGEPIKGDRKINEEQIRIVKRIFVDFAKGKSPKKIAHKLNDEAIKGPTGKGWTQSTINGNRRRGTGILNNELYIGRQIWNRLRYLKNPDTGKRESRLNPESEWIITDVPDLRTIDQDMWDAVKAYQFKLDRKVSYNQKPRPRKLFSFLLKCGCCGGGMSMVSTERYGCSTARNKGTCKNRITIMQSKLENSVIDALKTRLMDPELTNIFCKEYTTHINDIRHNNNAELIRNQKQLNKVKVDISKLIEAIKGGIDPTLIKDEINGLQFQKEQLIQKLDNSEEAPVYIHPRMSERYASSINNLITSLNDPDHRDESATLLRELIDKIVLTPNEDKNALVIDLYGDLAGILQISANNDGGINIKPKEMLDRKSVSELAQLQEFVNQPQSLTGTYLSTSKDQMVAGAHNSRKPRSPIMRQKINYSLCFFNQ
ncbi:MAG: recombinase family protein, partial [Rhizobiales bacterium]|nr:recombinase family protein [Hyphomicrobiales bacterium]